MKKALLLSMIVLIFPLTATMAGNQSLGERLSGKILLQVEDAGQAWYIDPTNNERAFLGRPDDAFRIMRELGLGISENSYSKFLSGVPENLSGKILLRVEANGEAYYVFPDDLKLYFLGRPADAFRVMREKGLGIATSDLGKVPVFEKYKENVVAEKKSIAVDEKPEIIKNNFDKENIEINKNISDSNSAISAIMDAKRDSNNFILETKNEMLEHESSNLVQNSGQQLINEGETQIFIGEKQIELLNKSITELSSLLNTGNTTTPTYEILQQQLQNYTDQYKISLNKTLNLIKTHTDNIAKSLDSQASVLNQENERVQKAVNALNEINEYIDLDDIKLAKLLNDLDDKQQEIDNIRNKPITTNSINAQLVEPTAEYNALANEYNATLATRSDLANLYNIVLEYANNNTPISYSDKQTLSSLGINL